MAWPTEAKFRSKVPLLRPAVATSPVYPTPTVASVPAATVADPPLTAKPSDAPANTPSRSENPSFAAALLISIVLPPTAPPARILPRFKVIALSEPDASR